MVQVEARVPRRVDGSVGSGHPWWILWQSWWQGNSLFFHILNVSNCCQMSHFLMGVSDQDKFLSVCRVSSGYTDHQLEGLTQKLSGTVISKQDQDVEYGKAKPDVFFNPRLVPVLQVKAAEIIASDTYATNVTLR